MRNVFNSYLLLHAGGWCMYVYRLGNPGITPAKKSIPINTRSSDPRYRRKR